MQELLEASGVPWEAVQGRRHIKVFVAGRMVQTVPRGKSGEAGMVNRSDMNALATVRRAIKRAQEDV